MSWDITFCVNKECPLRCYRKKWPQASAGMPYFLSMADFGKDEKGKTIDFSKCKYRMETDNVQKKCSRNRKTKGNKIIRTRTCSARQRVGVRGKTKKKRVAL